MLPISFARMHQSLVQINLSMQQRSGAYAPPVHGASDSRIWMCLDDDGAIACTGCQNESGRLARCAHIPLLRSRAIAAATILMPFCAGPKGQVLKTDVRMFRSDAIYYALIVVNFVLRFSWTYKLSPQLRDLRWFVFTVALLEIVRRWLWSFVRLENELRKIQGRQPSWSPLIPANPKRKASEYAFVPEAELSRMPLANQS